MSKIFKLYGAFCATHPWEVIVIVLTLTACFLTVEKQQSPILPKRPRTCTNCLEEQFNAADLIVMTIVRCLAILYSYHQFRNLQNLGSKYILGIAGLFVVFSSFVFTSTVLNILQIDLIEMKDALFFFLLLIDLSKAGTLAQFALTATSQEEISEKIARGMAILGPGITLDTIVETLVIGVGTLSGVSRLERLSYFACLSAIVSYLIFMTFYPACLSLMLELGKISNFYGEKQKSVSKMLIEEHEKSNPAVQRVKVIMSIGLLFVHIQSRWNIQTFDNLQNATSTYTSSPIDSCEDSSFLLCALKQITLSADHIVILILLTTLMIKFIFFESKNNLSLELEEQQLCRSVHEARVRTISNSVEVQTLQEAEILDELLEDSCRSLEECLQLYRTDSGANKLNDQEIMLLVDTKHIPSYNLEKAVQNPERGVKIRRKLLESTLKKTLTNLPYRNYDYSKVMGACCENVLGYVPVPVGVAGPLMLDGKQYFVPMATTEGCLVASTNRGCRAVEKFGIRSTVIADGMSRAPVVRFPSVSKASKAVSWLKKAEGFSYMKEKFDSTTRFGRLSKISTFMAGRLVYIRFVAETGDAMGMNMLSKGTETALKFMLTHFPEMEILSLSGNVCTDKKPSAINWIEGRGKSVVCETIIPAATVASVLKTSTKALVELNVSKNLVGSAISGSIGGFNAHAANIVTAIFIATGQDPAQNVSSSNCLTMMEATGDNGQDLYVTCTMPSIEIGTVGGGTILAPQSTCLEMLGVKGSHDLPGENAKQLARIVCASVLVGELSLMAALSSGHLVKSHLQLNRSCSSVEVPKPCDN